MRIHRPTLITGLVILVVLASLQIYQGVRQDHSGHQLTERPMGAPFTLQAYDGPFSLEDIGDRLALIYFGYTWCPDICPASMVFLAAAMDSLSETQRDQLQPIFISVDPERDTPDRLKAYVDFFEADIIGVTGEADELEALARQYGAFYRRVDMDSAMVYAMDHSADFYLTRNNGEILAILPHAVNVEQLSQTLQVALNEHL